MRNPWTILENAHLCFRLFIQDRVFPLVLTSSSSSKTKQIIAAATRLFTILFFLCVELLEELLEGLYKPFKHVSCYFV